MNTKTATAAHPALDPADIFTKAFEYTQVKDLQRIGLFPFFQPLGAQSGNEVEVNGERKLMVCSNDYLGLSQDQRVQQAGIPALEEFGTSCTGSRFLNGTLAIHEELERDLAKYEPEAQPLDLESALARVTAEKGGKLLKYNVFRQLTDLETLLEQKKIDEVEFQNMRKAVLDRAYQVSATPSPS